MEEIQSPVGEGYSLNGKNSFKLNFVNDNISHLLGEVLTIIDASLEGDKNKAVKDLIRNQFGKKQDWFAEVAWKDIPQGSETMKSTGRPSDEWYSGVVKLV